MIVLFHNKHPLKGSTSISDTYWEPLQDRSSRISVACFYPPRLSCERWWSWLGWAPNQGQRWTGVDRCCPQLESSWRRCGAVYCHSYTGDRKQGRQRAHVENECGPDHRTAAEHHCGEQISAAATQSEKTRWPLPGRQKQKLNWRNNFNSSKVSGQKKK